MFIINESKFSAIGIETVYDLSATYKVFVKETIAGVTKILGRDSLPNACAFGKLLPYYVSNTVGTTISVSGINVIPDTVKLQVNKSVALTATVLPNNATNKTVIWSSTDTALAKVDIITGVVTANAIGTAIIKGTTQDGNFVDSAIVIISPVGLTGSVTTFSTAANITEVGTADWAHWPGYEHKINGGNKISNFTVIGTGNPLTYTNSSLGLSWTDGTPTLVSNNNTSGLYIPGVGSGFSITIPADTTNQTFILYAALFAGEGRLTAELSDSSSPVYMDESVSGFGIVVNADYTINFKAASPNQTLTVKWILKNGGGNIALNGAALKGTTNFPIANNAARKNNQFSKTENKISQQIIVNNIKAYPNPANNFTEVVITAAGKNDNAVIMLCDANGKIVYRHSIPSFENRYIQKIDCSSIAKGIYFVTMNGIKLLEPIKIMVQ